MLPVRATGLAVLLQDIRVLAHFLEDLLSLAEVLLPLVDVVVRLFALEPFQKELVLHGDLHECMLPLVAVQAPKVLATGPLPSRRYIYEGLLRLHMDCAGTVCGRVMVE